VRVARESPRKLPVMTVFPREGHMRTTAAVVLVLAFLVGACSSVSPAAILAGDICYNCRKPITNVKIAAEAIDATGSPLKFRTVGCMARYLARHPEPMIGVFVTDYPTGRFLRAQNAMFVRAPVEEGARELDYYAFERVDKAVEFGQEQTASPVDWLSVLKRAATDKVTN
jgi:hypothetical protein